MNSFNHERGDEKCIQALKDTSPAPGETKGASLPQMPLIDGMEPEEWFSTLSDFEPEVDAWLTILRKHFAPPPQPKTQQEKDEDAFKRWWEDTKDDPYAGCISESQKQSWHAAIAYARGGERII